jgi:hypothetical protein
MLNDTRKHHSSFKLFVYPENDLDFDMPGFPLHVLSHKDSRDNMWQLKIGNPVNGDPNSHTRQPKWNLYNNGLQTDGSAPINKTLYFRLYDGKYPKDTENWTGPVFHPIATTMKNKKEYKNERNAKLIADKGWSLVRDGDNPFAYVLKGSKPDGRFFACAIPGAAEAALPDTFDGEDLDIDEASEFMNGMLSPFKLVYSADAPREGFATAGNSLVDRKGCSPVIIKVCCCHSALILSSSPITDRNIAGRGMDSPQAGLKLLDILTSCRPTSPLWWLNNVVSFVSFLLLPTMILGGLIGRVPWQLP